MSLLAPLLLAALLAPERPAPARQSVPHAQVAAAVRAHLEAMSADLPGEVELTVLGRAEPLALPAGQHALRLGEIPGRWPRPRVAVAVQHFVDGRHVRSQTVWVAVNWWRELDSYDANLPAGTAVAGIAHRKTRVDLARADGEPVDAAALPPAHRLRQPVRAGEPLLAEHFEPMPDVLAGAVLEVQVVRGAVHLNTSGRALADGFVGDVIPVALDAGRKPVNSTILSSLAVRVED
jgi:flagella basal body P-ring formation protein FlgA